MKFAKKPYTERALIKIGSIVEQKKYQATPLTDIAFELRLVANELEKSNDEEKIEMIHCEIASLINSIGVHQELVRQKADAEYQKRIGGTGGPSEYK